MHSVGPRMLEKSAKIEGEQLILDGTMQMQQAEADYARVRAGPSAKIDSPGS